MPSAAEILRWAKNSNLVTFVRPNSVVRPQAVCATESDVSETVTVYRAHERIISFFGAQEILELKVDTKTVIDGKTHVLYEAWIAPHLPPVNRHTKYIQDR